jgi:hypothetical protein
MKTERNRLTDEQIIERAREWSRLHLDPLTRGKMDAVLAGLSPADVRRVTLCGQRISGGLEPKIFKDV